MKRIWIAGMIFLPLNLQAMEEEGNFKTTLKKHSSSYKRSLTRSPTTTNLQALSEAVEVTKAPVEVIKVEVLHLSKEGPKTSKRGRASKNQSLLKDVLQREYMKKNLQHMEQELKKYEKPSEEGIALVDNSALVESIVRPVSPDFTREKN